MDRPPSEACDVREPGAPWLEEQSKIAAGPARGEGHAAGRSDGRSAACTSLRQSKLCSTICTISCARVQFSARYLLEFEQTREMGGPIMLPQRTCGCSSRLGSESQDLSNGSPKGCAELSGIVTKRGGDVQSVAVLWQDLPW